MGGPFAEQGRADSDMGRPQADGGFEVGAHTHGESGQAVRPGDLGQKREVGRRGLGGRGDAHQTLRRKLINAPADLDKGVDLSGGRAGLLRLLAGVDLYKDPDRAAQALSMIGEDFRKARPIQGFDDIEERDGFGGLVGLQRPYQAQLDALPPCPPARLGLLGPVLAEDGLASSENATDGIPRLPFSDRGEGDRGRIAADAAGSRGDTIEYQGAGDLRIGRRICQ